MGKDKRKSHHLTYSDRLYIEKWRKQKVRVAEVAERLGVSRQTIYKELKRGEYTSLTSEWENVTAYSPDIAEAHYRENLKAKGTGLKIGNHIEMADYMERKIAEDGYSPVAVIGEMKRTGKFEEFGCSICVTTLYSYIDKGIFLYVTNKELPVKGRRKKKKKKVRVQKRASAGESIENRPERINDRSEFGHWEMDTVVGPRGKSKCSFLTLTERMTTKEIIVKLEEHTAKAVVTALDALEHSLGQEVFRKLFKSITVDNGSEFADCDGMEQSAFSKNKEKEEDTDNRTKVYYAHPYSSWERGTNEVTNRMLRRKVPKGVNFDSITLEEVQNIEDWMNHYPRRKHGFRTADELYQAQVEALGLGA